MPQNILRTPRVLTGFDVKKDTIVFSRVHEEKELWIVSDGGLRKLCRGYLPVFVNHGIIYVYAKNGDRSDIFLYKNGVHVLTKEGRNLAPQPSPTGDTIAFLSDRNGPVSLYVLNLAKNVVECQCVFTPKNTYMRPGVWSPDGDYLVYWTRETPVHGSGIWNLNLRTRKAEQLIYFPDSSARVGSPYVWYLSPSESGSVKRNIWVNDDQFIFISDKKGYDTFGILTMEDSNIEWITSDTHSKEFYEVSPNGEWIAYNAYNDGTMCLVFLCIEDGVRREVKINGCLSHPVWYKNGVYCHESSFEGTGIVYVLLDGSPEYCYKEKPSVSTYQPIPVHYQSFDGKTIGGWLYNEIYTECWYGSMGVLLMYV
ncbi:MAG: hypothetical protein PVF58_21620 [Candidatus Methanofastidiosia archaeon]|jgi:Tol biopolymer transport system component